MYITNISNMRVTLRDKNLLSFYYLLYKNTPYQGDDSRPPLSNITFAEKFKVLITIVIETKILHVSIK
jgi:hypothetical protein